MSLTTTARRKRGIRMTTVYLTVTSRLLNGGRYHIAALTPIFRNNSGTTIQMKYLNEHY